MNTAGQENERRCKKCGRIMRINDGNGTVCRNCRKDHWKKMSAWQMGKRKYPGGLR